MATTTTLGPYTVADLERRREEGDERYELIDGGVFVVPSPDLDHQGIVVRLAHNFSPEVEERGLGRIFVAPMDTRFSQVRDVQPDLIVVRHGDGATLGRRRMRGSRRLSGRSSRRLAAPTIASESARSTPTRASRVPPVRAVDPERDVVLRAIRGDYRTEVVFNAEEGFRSATIPGIEIAVADRLPPSL